MFYYPQQQQTQYAATPTYMLPQTQFSGQYNALKGRPVSSLDEVRAAQVDFDGSLFIFPDIANKCIYTKQISANGTAVLNKYSLAEDMQPAIPAYVTKEEFEHCIAELNNKIAAAGQTSLIEHKEAPTILPHTF